MKTELMRFVPGLRSRYLEIMRLRKRVDELKAQREAYLHREKKPTEYSIAVKDQRSARVSWLSPHIPFNVIDRSVFVSLKHRYFYVETPKAGCSSMKLSLNRIEIGDPEAEFDHDGVHSRDLLPLLKPSQVANIEELVRSGGLRRFVFVRNPYTRVLSAYLQKIREPARDRPSLVGSMDSLSAYSGRQIPFHAFLEAVAGQSLDEMNPHWRPQFHQCFFEQVDFDFVGRFESLEPSMREILGAFAGEEFLSKFSPHATSASSKLTEFYDPTALRLAGEIYADDFEHLGYRKIENLPSDPDAIGELLPAAG